MIDLHYWPTPNGRKVSIMLEECGLPYALKPVNIGRGGQFSPEFLALTPNKRMPAIVDHDPPGGGAPLALFERPAARRGLDLGKELRLPQMDEEARKALFGQTAQSVRAGAHKRN